jgi:hypothetical protein
MFRMTICWEDDEETVIDFATKGQAIDWLATHEVDRRMQSISIEEIEGVQ